MDYEASGNLFLFGGEIPYNTCVYEGVGDITFRDRTLLAWWRLDEGSGTTLNDSSLYKRSGTTYNTPTWIAGNTAIRYGSPYALEFDGSNQYAMASADGLTNPAITILIWAKPKSLPNQVSVSHFTRDMVGSILWIGQSTLVLGGKYSPVGSLLFNGITEGFNSNAVESIGKLTFTGLARANTAGIFNVGGSLLFQGIATVTEAIGTQMTSGLVFSGLGDTNTAALIESIGKLRFNGIAVSNVDVITSGLGVMLLSGRSVNRATGIYLMTGSLTINGLAITSYSFRNDMTGGLGLSGTANLIATYTMNALGKLAFNGLATGGSQSMFIMVPNFDAVVANWHDPTFGTANLYQNVDEGTDVPNDSDYVSSDGQANNEIIFGLTDTPNDFTNLTAATGVIIRVRHTAAGSKSGRMIEEIQIVTSDNVTAITATAAAIDDTTITTYSYSPSITGTNTKASWDDARIRLKSGTGGGILGPTIYAIQVELYYNGGVFTVDMTGKLALQGSAGVTNATAMMAQGGLIFSGITDADWAGYRASGKKTLSGAATCVFGLTYSSSGSLTFSGHGSDTNDFYWLYTVNDTFTPTFTGNVSVECWAGGGGGGVTQSHGTGGGGGGAYAKLNTFAVTNGNNYTVNVGTGGVQNVTGDSWFSTTGTVFAAQGINGGTSGGGAGGQTVNCIGDVIHDGGGGGGSSSNPGGAGGGSSAGTAANGNVGSDSSGSLGASGGAAVTNGGAGGNGGNSSADGQDGTAPGGAGGGAGANANPGAGARGQIIVRRL